MQTLAVFGIAAYGAYRLMQQVSTDGRASSPTLRQLPYCSVFALAMHCTNGVLEGMLCAACCAETGNINIVGGTGNIKGGAGAAGWSCAVCCAKPATGLREERET
eukprot:324925-Chlamydomonas_euryale.AAC.1